MKKTTNVEQTLPKNINSEKAIVNVNKLKFFQGNPKQFTSKQFGKLMKSIKADGILEPLTVNKKTGTVLNGNQRLKVAMQLGIKELEVRYIDVDEKDEGYFVIMFNETLAEKDVDGMKALLEKYSKDSDFIRDLLSDYDTKLKNLMTGLIPEFEIVKDVDEKYDYILFITKKSIDFINVETFFNLEKVYDQHKSALIGMGRAVDAETLNKLITFAVSKGVNNVKEL